jgi:hypothetical protein
MKLQILHTTSNPFFKCIETDFIRFNLKSIFHFSLIFFSVLSLDISAQVVFDHPVATGAATNYSTSWTVPAGVNAITVEAWGGGAGGNGNVALPPQMFVGGGGGAYAEGKTTISNGQFLYIRHSPVAGPSNQYQGRAGSARVEWY